MLQKLSLFLLALVLSVDVFTQSIDWLGTVITDQFKGKSIFVKELDSLKPSCIVGRELNYCTETERLFDSKVLGFRNKQKKIVEKSDLDIVISTNNTATIAQDKYSFLIDYDFDLMNVTRVNSSIHYLKFDFLIIDLLTNEIIGRSSCSDLKKPFKGFKYLLKQLQEFQLESYRGG